MWRCGARPWPELSRSFVDLYCNAQLLWRSAIACTWSVRRLSALGHSCARPAPALNKLNAQPLLHSALGVVAKSCAGRAQRSATEALRR